MSATSLYCCVSIIFFFAFFLPLCLMSRGLLLPCVIAPLGMTSGNSDENIKLNNNKHVGTSIGTYIMGNSLVMVEMTVFFLGTITLLFTIRTTWYKHSWYKYWSPRAWGTRNEITVHFL